MKWIPQLITALLLVGPARLGHLELYGAVEGWTEGINGEAGISWTPAYRSTFSVDVAARTSRERPFLIRIRKGLELF